MSGNRITEEDVKKIDQEGKPWKLKASFYGSGGFGGQLNGLLGELRMPTDALPDQKKTADGTVSVGLPKHSDVKHDPVQDHR